MPFSAKQVPLLSDPGRLSELFRTERSKLNRFARQFLPEADAEDIVQEAFARLAAAPYAPVSYRAFLYKIARNLIIDHLRKGRVSVRALEADSLGAHQSGGSGPAQLVEIKSELNEAERLLASFPARQRTIFVLQAIQGYTYEEIAAELGVSLAIVRKDLQKAFAACARHTRTRSQSECVNKKTRRGSLRE